jgi:hypothetical protein
MITPENIRSIELIKSRGLYRNKQNVEAGRDLTDPITENFTGDGVRQTFNVALPIGKQPQVRILGVLQTLGLAGVHDDLPEYDWFWSKDKTEISQRRGLTPLTAGQILTVTYQGLYPVVVEAENGEEIERRKLIEGGSGVYEENESHPEIESSTTAFDLATARLRQHSDMENTVVIVTDRPGLLSGQFVHVDVPYMKLDDTFMILSVQASDTTETFLRYTATLVSGERTSGWLTHFQKLFAIKNAATLREDERLLLLRSFNEVVACGDELEFISFVGAESRIGFMNVGQSVIA